ncbi:Cadherin, partial [Oryctes borbonicus]
EITESSTSITDPCDCSLCPTTPADCLVTPQDCSECNSVTATTLDCSYCSAEICEEYVPCEECPTSPTTNPTASVSFLRDSYEFILAYNEVVSEVEWPVSAGSTIEEDITYNADDLPDQLDLDPANGMVTNNRFLPAGIHEFTITATGERSGGYATASVTITVQPFEVCSDGVRTTYSLLVKEVMENHPNTLLTTALEDEEVEPSYQLTIESVFPNTDLFYVSEDGQTLSCSALDRESNDFAELGATQYTVVVTITEPEAEITTVEEYRNNVLQISSELSTGKERSTRADASQCILISDMRNEPQRTTIVIIVGDENDNPPEFATTSMVVGYPANSLLSLIAPAYIVQVEATDADIGINAKLVYLIESSYVTIHPETGIVYPTEGIPNDDFTFTVTARDEEGEGLLSSNSLQVQVKRLQQEHISIIKLRSVVLEDLSTKIVELNAVTSV